jgi:NAD-dependent DNA ligase
MQLNNRFRFLVTSIIAFALGFVLASVIWLTLTKTSTATRSQPPQASAAPTQTAISAPLKGCNFYVCSDLSDARKAVDATITQRGGQLHSAIDVDTDYVVMAAASDTGESARVVEEAKTLHIPVITQAKLQELIEVR